MPDELREILEPYARRGVAEWRGAPAALRSRALRSLGMHIADSDYDINKALYTHYNNVDVSELRFIPMPMLGIKKVERCFFLPMMQFQDGEISEAAFDLVMLVQSTDIMAFRYEPAHRRARTKHGYPHAQLSRNVVKKKKELKSVPTWWPDTCPAFPFAAKTPLRLFLAMAVSVHGHKEGLLQLLLDLFSTVRPTYVTRYKKQTAYVIGDS